MLIEINPQVKLKDGDLLIAKKNKDGKLTFEYVNKNELLMEINVRVHELENKLIKNENKDAERETKFNEIQEDINSKLNKLIKIVGDVQ